MKHKANIRQHYAKFIELAHILVGKRLVRYNADKHRYEDCIHAAGRRVTMKERQTVAMLIRLQTNIMQQGMLLLELEQAIKREEAR